MTTKYILFQASFGRQSLRHQEICTTSQQDYACNIARELGQRLIEAGFGIILTGTVKPDAEIGEAAVRTCETLGIDPNERILAYPHGHESMPGAQLRYLINSAQRPVTALGFGAAAWLCAPRDRFIGWDRPERRRNLHRVISNTRFLILPWVQSRNFASIILGQAAKILPEQWQTVYGYRPLLLETFIGKDRFQGTCYQAANWLYLAKAKVSSGQLANRAFPSKTYGFSLWIGTSGIG